MGVERKLPRGTPVLDVFKALDPETRRQALAMLPEIEREAFDREWRAWAHEGQFVPVEPEGEDWSTWVIKGGGGSARRARGRSGSNR